MAIQLKLLAFLLILSVAGCGSNNSVERTNEATTQQLNEISQNTSELGGATASMPPSTPDELGQSMRAAAATKPKTD